MARLPALNALEIRPWLTVGDELLNLGLGDTPLNALEIRPWLTACPPLPASAMGGSRNALEIRPWLTGLGSLLCRWFACPRNALEIRPWLTEDDLLVFLVFRHSSQCLRNPSLVDGAPIMPKL